MSEDLSLAEHQHHVYATAGRYLTGHVPGICVHEHSRNDPPTVESFPISSVSPPKARVRVGIIVSSIIQFLFRRLLQSFRMDRKPGDLLLG